MNILDYGSQEYDVYSRKGKELFNFFSTSIRPSVCFPRVLNVSYIRTEGKNRHQSTFNSEPLHVTGLDDCFNTFQNSVVIRNFYQRYLFSGK